MRVTASAPTTMTAQATATAASDRRRTLTSGAPWLGVVVVGLAMAIEILLQDDGRRGGIESAAAAPPRRPALNHGAPSQLSGEALIPEYNRHLAGALDGLGQPL